MTARSPRIHVYEKIQKRACTSEGARVLRARLNSVRAKKIINAGEISNKFRDDEIDESVVIEFVAQPVKICDARNRIVGDDDFNLAERATTRQSAAAASNCAPRDYHIVRGGKFARQPAARREADALRNDVIISLSSPRTSLGGRAASRRASQTCSSRHYRTHFVAPSLCQSHSRRAESHYAAEHAPVSDSKCRGTDIKSACTDAKRALGKPSQPRSTHVFTLEDVGEIIVVVILITCRREVTAAAGQANLKSEPRARRKFLSEINPPPITPLLMIFARKMRD